jgi:hypothetical protein
MRTLLLFFFVSAGFFLQAQERCATAVYLNDKKQTAEMQAIKAADDFQQKHHLLRTASEKEDVIRVPVVVHVLYNATEQNISDVQIKSGIAALNRDFRRLSADTLNTPAHFRSLAADVQIEFYLATASPQGKPTSGIERKRTERIAWMPDEKIKQEAAGGLDAWDSKSYLNIWIGSLAGASGYATPPGSNAKTDGVVIHYNAFGTINTVAPFNLGRTAVHEVGHWLGLKHIWGDRSCGDDGVEDTPQQGFYTKGCPSGFRSSCNNGNAGDMYMNFMDYTNDNCMNLFTLGQRQRMRAAFEKGGPRASLLASKGLSESWATEAPLVETGVALYPNPAQDRLVLQTESSQAGKTVSFLNSQGQVIRVERITAPQQIFSVQQLNPGIYFLKGEGFLYKFVKL